LIVSFCNVKAGGSIAVYIDTDSTRSHGLDYGRDDLTSACGLAQDDEHIYSACGIGNTSFLAIFGKRDLRLRDLTPLPAVSDIHSICMDGAALIAASTGTDEIVRIPLDDTSHAEVIWRASTGKEDVHHLNAVSRYAGRLVCSGFGPKAGDRRSSALNGYIYDISDRAFLAKGIRQPHSLAEMDGVLYFCESSRSLLRTLDRSIMPIGGYLRGLACLEDGSCFVGASIARFDTASPGLVLNPVDPGARVGRCAIHVVHPREARASRSIDCSRFADEIYDIMPLTISGSTAANSDRT
jgi:hypothetical protein